MTESRDICPVCRRVHAGNVPPCNDLASPFDLPRFAPIVDTSLDEATTRSSAADLDDVFDDGRTEVQTARHPSTNDEVTRPAFARDENADGVSSSAPRPRVPTPTRLDAGSAQAAPAPRVRGSVIPSDPVRALVGETIDGRYRVEGVLAEGGMGVVYEAVQLDLGRRVAIKTLARTLAGDRDWVAVSQRSAGPRITRPSAHRRSQRLRDPRERHAVPRSPVLAFDSPPMPLNLVRPDVPMILSAVVEKLLAPDRKQRWPSAGAALEALTDRALVDRLPLSRGE